MIAAWGVQTSWNRLPQGPIATQQGAWHQRIDDNPLTAQIPGFSHRKSRLGPTFHTSLVPLCNAVRAWTAKHALDDLKHRRLKISRIMELNDPFEFLGVDLSDPTLRLALKKTKQQLSKTNGLLCFSKTWRNPVLWGHYAGSHRGMCLGFDVSRTFLTEVKYVTCRPPLPKVLNEEFMKHLLFAKFSHWQYEQEYRAYVNLDEKETDGLCFMDFSDRLKLRCVIVGEQSGVTRADVAGALEGIETGVEVFKARAGFRSFEVVRNKEESMWS